MFDKLELSLYEVYKKEIASLDTEIEISLASFEPKTLDEPPTTIKKRRKKPTANHPSFDLHKYIYQITGIDFTLINGLDALTVQTILSEVGLDPERFPTVKHFTSWLGLCPGQKVTGGKVKSSKTRQVVNRAANAFRMAAFSLTQSRSAQARFLSSLALSLGCPESNYCYCSQRAHVCSTTCGKRMGNILTLAWTTMSKNTKI